MYSRMRIMPLATCLLAALATGALTAVASASPTANAFGVAAQAAGAQITSVAAMTSYYEGQLAALPEADATEAVWASSTGCMRCDAGPLIAKAVSSHLGGETSALQQVLRALDSDISRHSTASGAISSPDAATTGSPDINTMFFADELGMAEIEITPAALGPTRTKLWTNTIAHAADFLVNNKNLSWYTNGNIVVGNTVTMALAFRLTGDQKYKVDYNKALAFAETPGARWPGRGFIVTKEPSSANGSNGAGYFTETGQAETGFDAEYTGLQTDQLARLWLINRDPRVLKLLNMTFNRLWPLVNTSTWSFEIGSGTRHPTPDRQDNFDTAALTVLALTGGRLDLDRWISGQTAAISADFHNPNSTAAGWLYAVGMEPTTIALADRDYLTRSGAPVETAALLRDRLPLIRSIPPRDTPARP